MGDVLDAAATHYGGSFQKVLDISQIWMNSEPVLRSAAAGPHDEIVVLPPISGG